LARYRVWLATNRDLKALSSGRWTNGESCHGFRLCLNNSRNRKI